MVSLADQVHVARLASGKTQVSLTFFFEVAGGSTGPSVPLSLDAPLVSQGRWPPGLLVRLAWLPLLFLIVVAAVIYGLGFSSVHDSPLLVTAFNTLFLAAGFLIVAYLAARSYLLSGSRSLLPLGAGALVLGITYLFAGPVITVPNRSVTINNSAILVGGLCFALAALWALAPKARPEPVGLTRELGLSYLGALVFAALLIWATVAGLLPVFYIKGQGFTLLREFVLGVGTLALLSASVGFAIGYRRLHTRFLLWCSLGLAFIGVAFGVVLVTGVAPGSAISWLGRSAQWLGGLCLLIGVFSLESGRSPWLLPIERALRESENRYQTLVDLSPDAIMVDVDGEVAFANSAAAQLLGARSPSELVGQVILPLLHPDDRELVAERMGQVLSGAVTPPREIRLLRLDGSQVEAEVTASRVQFDGRLATQMVMRDITERKRAEEALRDSEERHRSVLESMSEGLMLFDADRNLIYQNPASMRIHGYRAEEDGRIASEELASTWEGWDEDGRPLAFYEWPLSRVSRGDCFQDYVACARRVETGHEFWASYNGCPIDDRDGGFLYGFITINDVTERRRAEETLREAEERLRLALQGADLGTWDLDLTTDTAVRSLRHDQIWGYRELQSEWGLEIAMRHVFPEDRPLITEAYARAMETGVLSHENRVVWPDGSIHWIAADGRINYDSQGRAVRVAGVVADITARKQAEEERERLLAEEQSLTEELAAREGELQAQDEELRAGQYNRSLIEAALDPLVTIGPDGKITDVNEATIAITGRARDELIGSDFSDYFTDPESARRGYREVFAQGWVTDYPLTIRGKDGRLTDVLYNASVYRDHEGKVLGVFAAARDITALRELEEQRDIASKLQFALLYIPQQVWGVQFSHVYRSATKEASVGGDFYDVFTVKDGRIAVLIGDVSGHGVEAARIATLVKDVIHAFAHQSRRPSVVLRSTNELLLEKHIPGFVTLFLGILDPEDGSLTYSSAGHPNALLRSRGEVTMLEAASSPLGIFPDSSWKESEVQLSKEDLLLLYTDGAIEARHDGKFFGQEGLEDALAAWSEPSPELLPEVLLAEILAFSEGVLTDDVALLALSPNPPTPAFRPAFHAQTFTQRPLAHRWSSQ